MRASMWVTIGIGGLAALVASLFVLGYAVAVSRTGGDARRARRMARTPVLAWMTLYAVAAEKGWLLIMDARPPPFVFALVSWLGVSLGLGLSRVGATFARGLPVGVLVLAQSFRLPLELVMHRAASEGVMPVEMSFTGYNFDIVTGAAAPIVGLLALRGRAPRWLLFGFNVLGSVLLANIVAVAVLASPMFRAFGDDPRHVNTWVAHFPFVWLPSVLVVAAAFGHVVTFRALRASRAPSSPVHAS